MKPSTIMNWQLHTLSTTVERAKELGIPVETDKVYVVTGTVVDDPKGRWLPGYHMKSSVILSLNRETGECVTKNTTYILEGEEGGDVIGDWGDNVKNIFY